MPSSAPALSCPALPAGRSKGWGIVEFETPEEALSAINSLNGVDLGGRNILVREDREDRDVKQVCVSVRVAGQAGGGCSWVGDGHQVAEWGSH